MSKINLVSAPYCYSYTLPVNIAGLKALLQERGHECRCFDLSIEFYHHFKLLEEASELGKANLKYADRSLYLDMNNWNNRENFYQRLFVREEFKELLSLFAKRLCENAPEYLGFSLFNTNIWFSVELARLVRRAHPEIKIIFGGPDCTTALHFDYLKEIYQGFLKENLVDFIIVGEGEETLPEILEGKNESLGLLTKAGFTGFRPFVKDLDSFPHPDYSDLNFSLYPPSLIVPIVFNRGCNFNCAFCDVRIVWGGPKDFRHRTAKELTKEIKEVCSFLEQRREAYAILAGSYINTSTKILSELCDELESLWGDHPRLKWEGWAKFNQVLSPELCQRMAKAGCYSLVFGFESGSPKVCRDMNKSYSHEHAKEVLKSAKAAGIDNTLFTIVGFPTETEEDFQMTLDFLEENAPYIKRAYCISEFLMSSSMSSQAEKWKLKTPVNGYSWETRDEKNTLAIRKERLERFYAHIKRLGLAG